jgi:hypothetical protein
VLWPWRFWKMGKMEAGNQGRLAGNFYEGGSV